MITKKMLNRNYKPTKMWIDGKCFNIRQLPNKETKPKQTADADPEPQTSSDQFSVSATPDGKFLTSFHLPDFYRRKLTAMKHAPINITSLSAQTHTNISIPTCNSTLTKDNPVVITGDNESDVIETRETIHSVIGMLRDQSVAMQFISVPLLSDEITANYKRFKTEILRDLLTPSSSSGIEASLFQSPKKLHLTVVVFSLFDQSEINEAVQALNDYKEAVLDPLLQKTGPIRISVNGIENMNENVKKVDVLYAKAQISKVSSSDENNDEGPNLQTILDDLSNYFYEKGLVRKHQAHVKIHMTLMNSRYRNTNRNDIDSPRRGNHRWSKRESFDATQILEKYRTYNFGECLLDSIHLSQMSVIGDDGFYKPLAVVKLL